MIETDEITEGGGEYREERGGKTAAQPRLTGSKLETPTTAPMMAVSTTPPAPMLRRKFLREGETLLAASATSGTIMEAVIAAAVAAVSPATAFSFNEALTSNFAAGFDAALDGLSGSGAAVPGSFLWVARGSGSAIETAEVEAICVWEWIVGGEEGLVG